MIILIACLVASPVAYAHGGHDDGAAPQVTRAAAIELHVAADDSAPLVMEAQAEISADMPDIKPCLGGCCTSSHACCASLPIYPGSPTVPDTGLRDILIEPHLRTGLDPEALRKPPRSLS